jgi:hypothetical protein
MLPITANVITINVSCYTWLLPSRQAKAGEIERPGRKGLIRHGNRSTHVQLAGVLFDFLFLVAINKGLLLVSIKPIQMFGYLNYTNIPRLVLTDTACAIGEVSSPLANITLSVRMLEYALYNKTARQTSSNEEDIRMYLDILKRNSECIHKILDDLQEKDVSDTTTWDESTYEIADVY